MKRAWVVGVSAAWMVLAFACEPSEPESAGSGSTSSSSSGGRSTSFRRNDSSTSASSSSSSSSSSASSSPSSSSSSSGFFGSTASGAPPNFGETVTQAVPPPPISGGTLLVLQSGNTAVASDPDRDRVYIVDLNPPTLRTTVELQAGDEPGRLVEDNAGRVHVALRRGGAVVTINVSTGELVERRDVCGAPRGLAHDATRNMIFVACATGELVALPSGGGPAQWTRLLELDLRDVVVDGGGLLVSVFRTADVLAVNADTGVLEERIELPEVDPQAGATSGSSSSAGGPGRTRTPSVAWRMIPAPTMNGAFVLHQLSVTVTVDPAPSGYEAGNEECRDPRGVVASAVALVQRGVAPQPSVPLKGGAQGVMLAVDLSLSPDGTQLAVGGPGNALMEHGVQVKQAPLEQFLDQTRCGAAPGMDEHPGQVIAIAYAPSGNLVVQTREPAALLVGGTTVTLADDSRKDTGHAIFHSNSRGGISCASCHPEGRDDTRAWSFSGLGPRRTQSLLGGMMSTAPFHWDGDMTDLTHLVSEVFVGRMNGASLVPAQIMALGAWLNQLPSLPPPSGIDQAAAERGALLFADPVRDCLDCHEGTQFTDNSSKNVGTGGWFQVPSLNGVAYRTPLMHSGCAPTLTDRFTLSYCAGDQHGSVAGLSESEIADLVEYLKTL
ncbi:MAG: cytochrome-c peroxidase [Myxococcota bacterium]